MLGPNARWVRTRTEADARIFMRERQQAARDAKPPNLTRTKARILWGLCGLLVVGGIIAGFLGT